jgi:acyl-CoA synthetase (AMP-forming)/AMP-acid ligase II/1-acyl-sn-glycerol-3-phosphate acyltransferase/acyl carrier protein
MLNTLRYALWLLVRLLVSLRYRIRVHGWEQAHGLQSPVLLLPNHPGFIDPVLILATFYGAFRPRPVLYEENFRNPVLRLLMKLLKAVPIPDVDRPSQEARQRTEQAIAAVIEGLRGGENFVLWPSGWMQRDGVERLHGAKALTDILRAVPNANIVLVRTRGLWGSMFTFARTGKRPRLLRSFVIGFLLLLANLVFFMPRRRVEITVERLDRAKLPELERDKVNRWFEDWYNAEGPEQPTYVPYHFLFGPRTHEFPPPPAPTEGEIDLERIRPETRKAVAEIVSDQLGRSVSAEELRPDMRLDDMGLDSLQRMELALAVEKRFGVSADRTPLTAGELMALAEGLVEKASLKPPPAEWFRSPSDEGPPRIPGETIVEAFVARALADPREVAAADDLTGVVSYRRLLVGAQVMARRFARLPAANVGLMLSASVASDTMVLGLYLAGKLPVLLNWTTGPANLNRAVKLTRLTHVVTSRSLRDHLGIAIEGIQFLDVEDLHKDVGRFELLRTLLRARFLPGKVRRQVPQAPVDAPGVILFTSGSEKAPKAVPLMHRNIITNQRGAIAALGPMRRDLVLGFLPMFHSFGFTVTGLLPLLAGVRVVHHPDPTDASGLARKIAAYKPTILAGTPTFVGHIFERARPGELDSLRLIVVGAEKCPAALFEKCRQVTPGAHLLEGYGVTECSPVVAVNRPEANRPGSVGQPLPGVEVCVVDLETNATLPPGQMGMLLVSGPSVFAGYLGEEASPFVELEGKHWYKTGDLAEIDADGFIHLRGRLKRFLKAGGEMISLPALEEVFARLYPPTKDGPRVAVEGVETENGRHIVLFTTEPITLEEANALLQKEGFHGLLRLDEVRRIEKIPVLGNGKIDYKRLRKMVTEGAAATVQSPAVT